MSFEMKLDIEDVAEVSEDARGFRAQRKAIIKGLSGTGHGKILRALRPAVFDVTTGERMPQYGDPHPSIPGIICLSRTARAREGLCEVIIDYGVPDFILQPPSDVSPPQIEVGATVVEVETNLGIDGLPLTATYSPPLAPGEVGPPIPVTKTTPVRKQIPSVYFRFRRRETQSPGDKAKRFVGTMNSTVIFDDPPKFWLCTGITGTSNDFGVSYDVTYEFLRNEDSWDAVVAWFDDNGQIPSDVSFANGMARHVIYRSEDFYALNI